MESCHLFAALRVKFWKQALYHGNGGVSMLMVMSGARFG